MPQVLKLNSAYMPLEVISLKKAINLIERKKAEVVEIYEGKYLNTFKQVYEMPAVIRLVSFVCPKKDMKFIKPMTRQNIYDEFKGTCAYCGSHVSRQNMTIDHIIPRSSGGQSSWLNLVVACKKCNTKKGCKSLEESGMKLLQKPRVPILADSFQKGMIQKLKAIKWITSKKEFLSYLYWNVELEK